MNKVTKFLFEEWVKIKLWKRIFVKIILLFFVVVVIHYPNPYLLIKQISHFTNVESLINEKLPDIDGINNSINERLKKDHTKKAKYYAVQQFVYRNIHYKDDWVNWLNIDYWPTADEVWERKEEDCDGRAVLAVSILRSRGFKTAQIVGNISHIWVRIDKSEIMGPRKDKNFQTIITGKGKSKTKISKPDKNRMTKVFSYHIRKFPIARNILLIVLTLIIIIHPCKDRKVYYLGSIVGLLSFLYLKEWSISRQYYITFDFVIGMSLLIFAYVLSYVFSIKSCITKE